MKSVLIISMPAAAVIASLVLIVAASPPVFAAKSCDDYQNGNPKEGLRVLDEVEALVPFVPPEQAAYFEKELGAAFKVHSTERIGTLTLRPFYYACALHRDFANARDLLKEVDGVSEIAGIKLRIQIASRLPFDMSNARSAWEDYLWSPPAHTLTDEQVERGSGEMTKLTGLPGFYISCLAGLIEEKK
jgi:hypothetical protein